jgi:hypothetical protein
MSKEEIIQIENLRMLLARGIDTLNVYQIKLALNEASQLVEFYENRQQFADQELKKAVAPYQNLIAILIEEISAGAYHESQEHFLKIMIKEMKVICSNL